MTKGQRKSSRARNASRASRHGYRKQEPGLCEREVAGKFGFKSRAMIPNRAKRRGDQSWSRGETGRWRRQEARQARRNRLTKARHVLKVVRHQLRKRLRLEVARRIRASVH